MPGRFEIEIPSVRDISIITMDHHRHQEMTIIRHRLMGMAEAVPVWAVEDEVDTEEEEAMVEAVWPVTVEAAEVDIMVVRHRLEEDRRHLEIILPAVSIHLHRHPNEVHLQDNPIGPCWKSLQD